MFAGAVAFAPLPLMAQMTQAQWQAKAVAEFPDLAQRDSEFNKKFIELHQQRKAQNPAFFSDPAWPYQLAREVAQTVTPAAAQPTEVAQPTEATPPPEGEAAAPAPVAGFSQPSPGGASAQEAPVENPTEWEETQLPEAWGLEHASFRWWAPEGVNPVRGVLLGFPGRGGDGRGFATNPAWQALAQELGFAIVAGFLKNKPETPGNYQHDPGGGISNLINKAVTTLAKQNGQNLENPPLLFWGSSAGANVSQCYAAAYPNRVLGAVLMRCPNGSGRFKQGKQNVPLMIFVGGKDRPEWVKTSKEHYRKGLENKAVWTWALHPNEGHEVGNTWELSATYLRGIANLRLPRGTFASETPKMTRATRQEGWLGDPITYEIGEAKSYSGKKSEATWFPDEATATLWQSYLRNQ